MRHLIRAGVAQGAATVGALLLAGCAGTSAASPPAPQSSRPTQDAGDRVVAAVEAAAGTRSPALAVALVDPGRGLHVLVGRDQPVRAASTVKPLVYQARAAAGPLTARDQADAAAMIERSDNAATTRLWKAAGRSAALVREAGALGLTASGPTAVLLQPWDGWQTTAGDLARQASALVRSTAPEDRALVTLMTHVQRDQAWGVGSLAPAGSVAVKNGWVPVPGHGWVVNSMGCVDPDGPHPVCLAVTSTGNASFAAGVRLVDAAAAAAYRALSAG